MNIATVPSTAVNGTVNSLRLHLLRRYRTRFYPAQWTEMQRQRTNDECKIRFLCAGNDNDNDTVPGTSCRISNESAVIGSSFSAQVRAPTNTVSGCCTPAHRLYQDTNIVYNTSRGSLDRGGVCETIDMCVPCIYRRAILVGRHGLGSHSVCRFRMPNASFRYYGLLYSAPDGRSKGSRWACIPRLPLGSDADFNFCRISYIFHTYSVR